MTTIIFNLLRLECEAKSAQSKDSSEEVVLQLETSCALTQHCLLYRERIAAAMFP